jgi:phage gp16-like protein
VIVTPPWRDSSGVESLSNRATTAFSLITEAAKAARERTMASAAQIKKIHALKGALKLEDEVYRQLLGGFKVKSSTKLSIPKADELIKDLEEKAVALGVWEKRKPARKAKTTRKLADDDQSKKIRYLWLQLHKVGKVKDPSETALASYVNRMTNVAALQWLSVNQASRVIEAMKKWLER